MMTAALPTQAARGDPDVSRSPIQRFEEAAMSLEMNARAWGDVGE
jgi:hypothetical protein